MKKILLSLSVIILCLSMFGVHARAEEEYNIDSKYYVVFDADGETVKLLDEEGNLIEAEEDAFNALFQNVQPGDRVRITFILQNEYSKSINWYMKNWSTAFEKKSGKNASYEYVLKYSAMDDDIYNSMTVGGEQEQEEENTGSKAPEAEGSTDDATGIEQATEGLLDYFLLHEGFANGDEENLVLTLVIDGETAKKDYENALGELSFKFAVEIPLDAEEVHKEKIIYVPYTGDTMNVMVYVIAEILSILLMLVVLYAYYRYRRKQREA